MLHTHRALLRPEPPGRRIKPHKNIVTDIELANAA